MAKNSKAKQNSKFKGGAKHKKGKCVLMFDDKNRQDFLTGFHKRKLERRRAALEEMKNKLKEEQKRLRDERHKEYLKMLQERREALEEDDELEEAITSTTECVQYDHPNHTVTVTTISDLDLSAARLLEPPQRDEADGEEEREKTEALPRKAGNPLMSKKIQSLTASVNSLSKQKSSRKRRSKKEMRRRSQQRDRRAASSAENKTRPGKSGKRLRRLRTGRHERHLD